MFWIELFVATLACAILTTALYYGRLDNVDQQRRPVTRGLTDAVLFIARRFQAAIALMLGFYMIQCFNRWVAARSLEGAVMGKLRDLSLQIAWRIKVPVTAKPKSQRAMNVKTVKQSQQQQERHQHSSFDVEQGHGTQAEAGQAQENGSSAVQNNDKDEEYGAFNRMDVDDEGMTVEFVQLQLVRWINLAHAIVVGSVYQKPPPSSSSSQPPPHDHSTDTITTPLFQALVDQGLATHREAT